VKKLLLVMVLLSSYLFGAINVQTASKAELMSISGIGDKKADAIIKYRKKHKLKSADDLVKVPGIGKSIVNNVKKDVKNKKKQSAKKKKMHKKQKSKSKQVSQKEIKKKITHKKSMKKQHTKKMKK